MTKRPHKTQKTQLNLQELVVVTFAEDMEQARDYESLLKTNDIPTLVKEEDDDIDEFDEEFFDEDF